MLINTRMNGQPSLAEQAEMAAKRKRDATQIFDGPAERDHTLSTPDSPDGHTDHVAEDAGFDAAAADADAPNAPDRHRVKSAGRLENAIERHNANAPTANRPGRDLVGGPTSPDRAPLAPTGGTNAPAAPVLSDERHVGSGSPDSLATAAEAARDGATRAQTRAPEGLDFTSSGPGVHQAARHPDGSFVGQGDVPMARLDLTKQGGHDAAQVFSRPNASLPARAMNGPSTRQPNTSTNERND